MPASRDLSIQALSLFYTHMPCLHPGILVFRHSHCSIHICRACIQGSALLFYTHMPCLHPGILVFRHSHCVLYTYAVPASRDLSIQALSLFYTHMPCLHPGILVFRHSHCSIHICMPYLHPGIIVFRHSHCSISITMEMVKSPSKSHKSLMVVRPTRDTTKAPTHFTLQTITAIIRRRWGRNERRLGEGEVGVRGVGR